MTAGWQVGVDIGGTFTDVVASEAESGAVRVAKVPSRPDDPIASVGAGLDAVGLAWSQVGDLIHGTTIATNAIVEGKLARVALVATEGFRDVLAIGRQNRRELYRLDSLPKLPPLVDDEFRLEVRERLDADGRILTLLTAESVELVARDVARLGVQAAAVALLHAYANPSHEVMLGERLARVIPHVALSHRVSPEAREYERTASTVLNAALMPLIARYVERLLALAGNATRVHLFHSAGGMTSPAAAKDHPLALALSGPAAGVSAAGRVAAELELGQVISFDMGGTTTDVCLVTNGSAQVTSETMLAGRPVRQPMVAVHTIGAGGGSLAEVQGSAIRVGPESVGALPGPACYGLGGTRATVTDANLVLGYLGSDRPLGGRLRLEPEQARAAVGGIARAFGVPLRDAALGIVRVANASIVRALRRVTVECGVDARDSVLLAYGGAGPMHAVALARELGISRVLVPCFSSMFSALGCITAELSYARQLTVRIPSRCWDGDRLEAARGELLARLSRPLLEAGHGEGALRIEHVAAIRYAGQSYAVEVPCAAPIDPAALDPAFKAAHRRLYGFATDEPWLLESLRVKVSAGSRDGTLPLPRSAPSGALEAAGESACWFDGGGAVPTPRFDRAALPVNHAVAGPAVIEDAWSTIVVDPGAAAWADSKGHLHLEVRRRP